MPPTPSGPRPSGPRAGRSALEGTSRLLVDGTNLLYRMGNRGSAAAPPAALVGRLRGAIPATVTIDLVFDGMGHGVFGRVAQGMAVRYSGRRTADEVLLDLTSEAASVHGAGRSGADHVLVVTNDRDLRHQLEAKGARTVPAQWLLGRLDLPVMASPAPGNKRPPTAIGTGTPAAASGAGDDGDPVRRPWKPGRGATTKTGPARKVARHKRHPRHPG